MKTPAEKYMNDPEYNALVKTLESFLHQARYTPSEMREACVLACINYEMKRVREFTIDEKTFEALRTLENFATRRPRN